MTRDDRPKADDQFAELLSQFDEALAAGTTTDSGAEGVRQADPELADRLQRAVRSLQRLDKVRQLCGGPPYSVAPGDPASEGDGADGAPEGPHTIDRFRIVRELGSGGYGIVYLVYDPVLEREIALKVPRPEVLVRPELKQRFLREAKAAAALNHPNIVAVYETGQAGPVCWIAEEYCQGVSLAERLNAEGQPIRARAAARVMADLADAVEHAHQRAILHRDLKPGNVILEQQTTNRLEEGTKVDAEDDLIDVTAKLTDFGLAKVTEQDSAETRTGAMLGTPSYMAPEQADAAQGPVGPATDVYGLGTILYEMLTRRPPYRAATSTDTLRQVLLDDPVPPTRLRLGLAKDLEAICLKCLERRLRDRYASARELAADLRRFLAGKPTVARPLGPAGRALKWSRHHPTTVAILATTALFLTVSLIGGSWQLHRLRRELATNEQLRQEAELRDWQRYHDQYRSDIQLAQRLWQEGKLKQTRRLLGKYLPENGPSGVAPTDQPPTRGDRRTQAPDARRDSDLRDFAWRYLWQKCHGQLTTYRGHTEDVCAIAFSPDGTRIATAEHDGTARLFATQSGQELAVLRGHGGEVNCVAFTPDGRLLATGSDDGVIKLWDVETYRTLATLEGHQDDVLCLAISPDGQRLASGGADHIIRLWQLESRQLVGTLEEHSDWIRGLAFSPNGQTLASCSDDGTLKLWDVSGDEARLRTSVWHGAWVLSVAFGPDGSAVATGCKDRYARLWNADTGEALANSLPNEDWVRGVALSGDGKYLAAVGSGHLIKVWSLENIASPELVREIPGHLARTWAVAFAPDSMTMATAGGDGLAKRWRVGDDPHWDEIWELPAGMALDDFVLSNDGATVALVLEQQGEEAEDNVELRIWDRSRRVETAVRRGMTLLAGAVFSPDGRHVAFVGSGSSVEQLTVDTLERSRRFSGPSGNYGRVAFHPDGKTLASTHGHGSVRLWDSTAGTYRDLVLTVEQDATLIDVRFSPDGQTLAARDYNNKTVILYDMKSGTVRKVLTECDEAMAFSGDGAQLATGCQDRTVQIWDVHSGRLLRTISGHNQSLQAVAFSPDGSVLASVPGRRAPNGRLAIKIWAADSGEELLTIPTELASVAGLTFTPDGNTLMVGGERWRETDEGLLREPLVLFYLGGDPSRRAIRCRFRAP